MALTKRAIKIDCSEFQKTIDEIKKQLNEKAVKTILTRTISNTGRKVKSIVGKEVPKKYEAKRNWVTSQVKKPYKSGLGDLGTIIPLQGPRGKIGGEGEFKATGGMRWRRIGSGKAVREESPIYSMQEKGKNSRLPGTMKRQGGHPPFRNLSAPSLHGLTFTRKTNKPLPFVRVVGLNVPQMPMNKSEQDVTDEIIKYMDKELNRNINNALKNL